MKHRKRKLLALELPLSFQIIIPLLAKKFIRSKASSDQNTVKTLDWVWIRNAKKAKASTQEQMKPLCILFE